MRGKSHHCLGRYLARHYLSEVSSLSQRAFLLGCIQPDRNPATYIKGSIRQDWLRGHNFLNASRYMHRIAGRLESRKRLRLWDYYTLGKLIHYTADAFTDAHNEGFSMDMTLHIQYEVALQEYFLAFMTQAPAPAWNNAASDSIMDFIRRLHGEYRLSPGSIHRDTLFSLHVCCGILGTLQQKFCL